MARTILLADDSVTIQKVVELTFLDEDFRVVCYGNGADAIAALEGLRPDVVLADVHMPGADGYEVCAAAQAAQPGVPVLLLVGTFEVFDAQRASQVGARGHLKKPFDSQELLRQVQELAAGESEAPAVPPVEEETIDMGSAGAEQAALEEAELPEFEPMTAAPPFAAAEEAPPAVAESFMEETEAETPTPESTAAAEVTAVGAAEAVVEPGGAAQLELSEADVDRIARRVVELIGEGAVRDVAWEVVPDLAELLLKSRIRELEASVE